MNNKLRLILVILAIITGVLVFCYGKASGDERFKNGDYIYPIPLPSKSLDCDDITLYSYYYLQAVNPQLKITIKRGYAWNHVWLSVSDNESTYIYDYGTPYDNTDGELDKYFYGRNMSLLALTTEVRKDLY